MLGVAGSDYRVLLPLWVFKNATNKYEVKENAETYIRKAYPDRRFIRVDGKYAICVSNF